MREIKFRMWDKVAKKYRAIDSIAFDRDTGAVKVANGWGEDIIEDKDIICHREPPMFVLEQFIGRKDINEREIYEGDIVYWLVNTDIEKVAAVYYDDEGACFWMGKDRYDNLVINDWMRGEYTVLGNIHENLELLK